MFPSIFITFPPLYSRLLRSDPFWTSPSLPVSLAFQGFIYACGGRRVCLKYARSTANVIFRRYQRGSYRQIMFRISRTITADRRPLFIRQISSSSSCLLVAYLFFSFFFFEIILCDTIYTFCCQSLLSYQARTNYAGRRAACSVISNLRGLLSSIVHVGWMAQDDPTLVFFSLIVVFCDKSNVTTILLLVS